MKLIKINTGHYIIVDDSEIKEGDWMYNPEREPSLLQCIGKGSLRGWQKITHSKQPLEVKITDEGIHLPDWSKVKALSPKVVKELIGEVDVEKKAREIVINNNPFGSENFSVSTFNGLVKDITKALEDNKEKKYTEDDLRKAMQMYKGEFTKGIVYSQEQIIQSLQPKTEWEVEIIDGKLKLK